MLIKVARDLLLRIYWMTITVMESNTINHAVSKPSTLDNSGLFRVING